MSGQTKAAPKLLPNRALVNQVGRSPFAHMLWQSRTRKRMSQLDLALASNVSQRHVSFLESGRSRPSLNMVLQLAEALELPLRERNLLLTAAGFAERFQARTVDDPAMALINRAVDFMLQQNMPNPAVAVDGSWNILRSNPSFDLLIGLLGPNIWQDIEDDGRRSLVRLTFHSQGLRKFATNWAEVAPKMIQRIRREITVSDQYLQNLMQEFLPNLDTQIVEAAEFLPMSPVVALDLSYQGMVLSFFTVITSFGTTADVTVEELRIETFFPADDQSAQLLRMITSQG